MFLFAFAFVFVLLLLFFPAVNRKLFDLNKIPTIARGVTATTADRRGEERKREREGENINYNAHLAK